MMGDFTAEKEHVRSEMHKKLESLVVDRVLSRREKEVVIRIAVCLFCCSAGLVDWTRSELDTISKMWIRAYKQFLDLPRSANSSPMILEQA